MPSPDYNRELTPNTLVDEAMRFIIESIDKTHKPDRDGEDPDALVIGYLIGAGFAFIEPGATFSDLRIDFTAKGRAAAVHYKVRSDKSG